MKQVLCVSLWLLGSMGVVMAEEKAELPKVLIIGDSISMGYTPPLAKLLAGKARVIHNKGNAAHTAHGLANLDAWLGDTEWAVIHFNHGLHDLKHIGDPLKLQIPLAEYEKNMEAIVQRLKKTNAKLIFATTTPFPKGVKPKRIPEDAVRYNDVALAIMKKHGVAVNDLYAFVLPQMETLQRKVNVHFTPAGSKALAEEVEKHILKALEE